MRGMCSTMLLLQAIIVALSTPVMIAVEDIAKPTAMWVGFGLAVVCLITIGLLRWPFGYVIGFILQAATVATGFLVPTMFIIGAMFAALWFGAWQLGRKIEAHKPTLT